jgi:hypothetical protein
MSKLAPKDPNAVDFYFIIWCSKDGTNDGSEDDIGELQGATIQSDSWTVPTGITEASSNNAEITIRGVTYAINTSSTIKLSGGTAGIDYDLVNRIITSDGRTLDKTITIRIREQ